MPPFTLMVWPLTQPPSRPTRKLTTKANPRAGPAVRAAALWKLLDEFRRVAFMKRSVEVGPGATALTVMLRPLISPARVIVKASIAALVAA